MLCRVYINLIYLALHHDTSDFRKWPLLHTLLSGTTKALQLPSFLCATNWTWEHSGMLVSWTTFAVSRLTHSWKHEPRLCWNGYYVPVHPSAVHYWSVVRCKIGWQTDFSLPFGIADPQRGRETGNAPRGQALRYSVWMLDKQEMNSSSTEGVDSLLVVEAPVVMKLTGQHASLKNCFVRRSFSTTCIIYKQVVQTTEGVVLLSVAGWDFWIGWMHCANSFIWMPNPYLYVYTIIWLDAHLQYWWQVDARGA